MRCSGWIGAGLVVLALAGPVPAQPGPLPPRAAEAPPVGASARSGDPEPAEVREVGGKSLAQWKRELKNPDPSIRARAIQSIIRFGPAAGEAVPLLLDRCGDRDASPRVKAVIALRLVPVDARDVPKVVETLARRVAPSSESQAIVRYEAASTLLHFADHARAAVPALLAGADDGACWETRQTCLAALRRAAGDPRKGPDSRATHALLAALRDPTAQVRLEATIGLGDMGRPADPQLRGMVVRALQGQLNSRDRALALWSHASLMALDQVTNAGLEAIAQNLRNSDLEVRLQAAQALSALGYQARPTYPSLIEMLGDREPAAVAAACSALAAVEASNPQVLSALEGVSRRGDLGRPVKTLAKAALDQLRKGPK
jgi:HEAT repeat protein